MSSSFIIYMYLLFDDTDVLNIWFSYQIHVHVLI